MVAVKRATWLSWWAQVILRSCVSVYESLSLSLSLCTCVCACVRNFLSLALFHAYVRVHMHAHVGPIAHGP